MILGLVAAAAAQATAVDAERAFADMAQRQGQWTAFRAYAEPDALMFVPAPTKAHDFLRDRKDPPASVHWWPSRSWVSCDGATGVNIGPALYGISGHGTFTTVWRRQADGSWKWALDQGHQVPKALPATERPAVKRASCAGRPRATPPAGSTATAAGDLLVLEEGRMPAARPSIQPRVAKAIASGSSPDGTLHWSMNGIEGGGVGARVLHVHLWDGRGYRLHLVDIHEGRPAQ